MKEWIGEGEGVGRGMKALEGAGQRRAGERGREGRERLLRLIKFFPPLLHVASQRYSHDHNVQRANRPLLHSWLSS